MKKTLRCVAFGLLMACGIHPLSAAPLFDAGRDLLLNEQPNNAGEVNNPNATVPNWSYGYRATTLGPAVTFYTAADHVNGQTPGNQFDGFSDSNGSPCCGALPHVWVNTGATIGNPQANIAQGEMSIHPDGDAGGNFTAEQKVVVRFTATTAGTYNVNAFWEDANDCCGGAGAGVDVHVVKNTLIGGTSASLFDDAVSRESDNALPDLTTYVGNVALAVGDSLDFVVGTNSQLYGDETRFNATLNLVPEPSSLILAMLAMVGLLVVRRKSS